MVVIALLLAALVAAGCSRKEPGVSVDDADSASQTTTTTTPPPAPEAPARRRASIATIARRVEDIRDLKFKRLPEIRTVTPAEAKREGLSELTDKDAVATQRSSEEVLKLLGLIPTASTLRDIQGSIFGEAVAGYYDPRRKRLTIVEQEGGSSALDEITIAHELVHALEDQRFGLTEPKGDTDDGDSARQALTEGTATAVMFDYALKHLRDPESLGDLGDGEDGTEGLPPYVREALTFPYFKGRVFVNELYRLGRGWQLVDLALRFRPPASTEQVLHPQDYIEVNQPLAVRLRVGAALGRGWRRVAAGSIGEFDSEELLRPVQEPDAARAAAIGWGGGRYELWRTGPLPARGCPAPCRPRDVLVSSWRWDTPRDAREFNALLPKAMARGLRARPAGRGTWTVPGDGAMAIVAGRTTTTLVLAPNVEVAARVARAAPVGGNR